MSSRTEAFDRYLRDIYHQYDALLRNERLINAVRLSAVEIQPEQIISVSENFSIEDLLLLVLFQVSREEEDDLRDLLAEMRAATQAKRRLRDVIAKLKQQMESEEQKLRDEYNHEHDDRRHLEFESVDFDSFLQLIVVAAADQSNREVLALADELTLTRQRIRYAEADDAPDQIKEKLDALSELGEMESLRLQMALDRRSKFISTLSNILKKMSDTDESIVQNIK